MKMNRRNLEILGLEEGATSEQIEEAYKSLREKYLEERFMEGEAGNNAAKMLTKIETARSELLAELAESPAEEEGSSFSRVDELIKAGDYQEAQRVLDSFNERGAHWHYMQSMLYYRKSWVNESKKQLEIALKLDPENEKYKEAYKRLKDKIAYDAAGRRDDGTTRREDGNQSAYRGRDMSYDEDDQMGGGFCSDCLRCLCLLECCNCLCGPRY